MKRYKFDLPYIFNKFDADKDERLNLIEFDALLVSAGVKLPDDQLNEAFQAFDLDDSDFVEFPDFASAMNGTKIIEKKLKVRLEGT